MSAPIWITAEGLAGVYPMLIPMTLQLVATNATNFKIISGNLPNGLSIRRDGLISGTPTIVPDDTTSTFVVRATSATGDIRDRTFSIRISGEAIPTFITPGGSLLTTFDSVWVETAIQYENPIANNPISIRLLQGSLPPGLEINESGLIRGYPEPPVIIRNLPEVTSVAIATDSTNNYVTVLGTTNMTVGRPISFSGSSLGGIVSGQIYYILSIVNATQITIGNTPNGESINVTTASGFMDVTLPATQIGEPTKRQYSFTLQLVSPLGNDTDIYSITVLNHYLPAAQGGPNPTNPPNTRLPTIYNTRPPTYQIEGTENFGYYVLPPADEIEVPGETYAPTQEAYIGQILSDNYFAFRIIGHDFDNNELLYEFLDVPPFLTGDQVTGWIFGTPLTSLNFIEQFSFKVFAYKKNNSTFRTPTFNFSFNVANNIDGIITWDTDSNLGTIFNASTSYKYVAATCDVPLEYDIVGGSLPPNLTLKPNGDIEGIVAYQPTNTYVDTGTTDFTFTIRAKSIDPNLASIVTSTKQFTLTVDHYYDQPTDNLYIKCTPSTEDREILRTLLNDPVLIPDEYLYRSEDPNFGKASNITYAHAYGIYSSTYKEYIAAVQKNHYWRNIILGDLRTAVAKDEEGNIIYEVVYSTVIDNLQKYEPATLTHPDYDYRFSESISEEIFWPRFIDLNLGPWYTSSTEILTSWIFANDAQLITNLREYDLLTQTGIPILLQQGVPTFYTSLTPGYARLLYPNSLANMRKRVEQNLGADYNFRILPLWMTSQQSDGNTLGFTPAWVICYTKPGYSNIVKNNIINNWPYTLNQINFTIDRFTVDKQITFNFNSQLNPGAWTRYPSATPTPDPIDDQNFYVLFPQKTILPTKTQYNL